MTMLPFAIPSDLNEWAQDFEAEGGYPAADTPALEAWGAAEGGSFNNSAYGNVLNTTLGEPGSSSINSVGVQSYKIAGQTQAQDWQTGIDADLATINQKNMADIKADLESNPSALPSALAKDPWGTNPTTVGKLLGESSAQLSALGSETGSGSAPATLTGFNLNPLDLFGIPQTAATAVWNDVGPFLVKAILVVAGLGVMGLGLAKLTDAGPKIKEVGEAAGPALAAAAA